MYFWQLDKKVEFPEETFVEEIETPEGKPKQKKITKRIIKKRLGPKVETTQIISEQEDDKTPVVTVHTTHELIDDSLKPLEQLHKPGRATILKEEPEEVKVTEVKTETGETQKVKTTKRVIKKRHGEEPVTTVEVLEEKAPEDDAKPVEIVEFPEETVVEDIETPEGKPKQKKITKRIIKKTF